VAEPGSISPGEIAAGSADFILDEAGLILEIRATGANARLAAGLAEGEGIAQCVHPDDREFFALARHWVMQSGTPDTGPTIRIRWARSNGHYSHVYATVVSPSDETVSVRLTRDEAEQAHRTALQLRKVAEGSLQGIIVRTSNEILFMNDSFAHLVGYNSARELMAENGPGGPNGLIHPDDIPIILDRVKRRVASKEAISHYEIRLLHRDGKYRWMDTLATAVEWDGQMASLSWLTDITERKALEAEIIRSKEAAEFANRTKTEFLAHMSHELRTPLNAIIGFAEVIKDQLFGPVGKPNYVDYANDIHSSGRHLLDLINDILDLSKLEAGRMELRETDVSLSGIVEQTCTLMSNNARSSGVKLVCDAPESVPLLRADERALRQVMLNFLSNAIKFTPRGGRVTAAVRAMSDGSLKCSIADTGIGMNADEIRVALMPFGQVDSKIARQHKGTGLGLPISKSLIELHGGELRIQSEPGKGTTLFAIFPPSRVCRAAA
jgi:PAS domain S-box-containing protein